MFKFIIFIGIKPSKETKFYLEVRYHNICGTYLLFHNFYDITYLENIDTIHSFGKEKSNAETTYA